jgi:pyrimidine operon attenuation protein/uracil phosphoribosyltransferase
MAENIVMDSAAMNRAITRMTYEIIERNKGVQDIVIVGIKTRGESLGERMANRLKELEGVDIPFVALDISAYRDDVDDSTLNTVSNNLLTESTIEFTNKHIFLVDDVLQTGRTIRAAMDAVMDAGRASRISLAVLIDRGHRELPIRADIVGKNLPTSKSELVDVQLIEHDGEDQVIIRK